MKLTKPLSLYLGIIVISLSIIGFTLYYFYKDMGGFDEMVVVELEPIKRTIVGLSYTGKAQTPEYEELVAKCVDQIKNNRLKGVLTIVSHKHDTLENTEMHIFIGVTLQSSMAEIPYDFEVKDLTSKARYAVNLTMHPMVRPSVEDVENQLLEHAQRKSKELLPMFVELYYMDNTMTVEAWTK
ncbi:MAG: hypothetical protein RIC06_17690 [Cyclobacteriaceae bacterium]